SLNQKQMDVSVSKRCSIPLSSWVRSGIIIREPKHEVVAVADSHLKPLQSTDVQ
ncbi:unnamed protein product, partial [Sphenostylis stenocarpa]